MHPATLQSQAPPGRGGWSRLPRLAGEYAAFYGFLFVLGAVFLVWSPVGAVLSRALPRRIATPLGQGVIRGGFRGLIALAEALGLMRCDLAALDALWEERGLVVAPNHPSLLDVLLIGSRVPRAVCITKARLWDNPFLGGGARMAGYIRNDVPLRLVRRAAAEVRAGANLLVFPEGTRTVGGGAVNPFKPGFALIARQAGAPVQVVLIESDTPYLRKGWPLLRKPSFPLVYRVRLGPRVPVEGQTDAFAGRLEQLYTAALTGGAPD
jgi:1-acyl-sn-glycerol-3-phosphate acyltransferase